MERWSLWEDINRSPALNMAIDEDLLQETATLKKPLLRVYGWDRPSVSIGYVQKYAAAPQTGYTIVRRPTGGGIVFHDVDLTYTVVIPKGHWIEKRDRLESYHIFHRVIVEALNSLNISTKLASSEAQTVDRATMSCFTSPTRYDIISTDNKAKVAGAAQRRTKNGILHQGSIVVEDLSSMRKTLIQSLLSAFEQELAVNFVNFSPSTNFLISAGRLAQKKYATEAWNKYRKIS